MAEQSMSLAICALLLVSCLQASVAEDPTVSNIIGSAGAADLYYGTGDVPATGPCKSEIAAFCKDVKGGGGAFANCLTMRIRATRLANSVGKKVSSKCIEDLAAFKIDRSSHINKDVPLAKACKEDVEKLCPKVSDEQNPGSVLGCLRSQKQKLSSSSCKGEVFRTQIEALEDYRTDYKMRLACTDDIDNLCSDVDPGNGREIECLTSKRIQVSWECQDAMLREEASAEDDIRLHVRLFNLCYTDFKRFCKDVEPGAMRVQECLEDNMDDSDFSPSCAEELDNTIAKRVADFRLDEGLRDACESELNDLCGLTLDQMDEDEAMKIRGLNCLQQFQEDIRSEACKSEVHRRMQRASRDVRFDDVLASACAEDRAQYCVDVSPGSARVIRCLEEHRTSLQSSCAAALFDHEVQMAENIDFQYPLKRACAFEIMTLCSNIPHGHARVVRCLDDNLDDEDMSGECKKEVQRNQNRMGQDYRLNYRLKDACSEEINKLCPMACSSTGNMCGGLVLQCLQDNQDNITKEACQEEVFYYELMEVSDFRNDVILAEACRDDVQSYCSDVEPGEGRVHTCLRFNRDKISASCLKEELKLQAIEYRDIRLRPKLNKLCSEEKAVFCKDVRSGGGRVMKCLMENMAETNFGEDCKEELEKREGDMQSDYRFDIGVATNCKADVEMFCAEEKTKLRGTASVLKCLASNFRSLADPCQAEMSRAVRLALWDYKPGAPLTNACDADVESICPKGNSKGKGSMFSIGVTGRCLSRALVENKRLDLKCRSLVLVAAPKDARAYFDLGTDSANMVLQKIADLQEGAGMQGVLVDTHGSQVTVTGWVAFACIMSIIIVTIGSLVILYRRAVGEDRPYTLIVKSGDD